MAAVWVFSFRSDVPTIAKTCTLQRTLIVETHTFCFSGKSDKCSANIETDGKCL